MNINNSPVVSRALSGSNLSRLNVIFSNEIASFYNENDFISNGFVLAQFSYLSEWTSKIDSLNNSALVSIVNFHKNAFDEIDDVKIKIATHLGEVFPKISKRLITLAKVKDGWDGDDAKSMSVESLGMLRRFLLKAELSLEDMGLYLDYDGSIIISFTSLKVGLMDITFIRDRLIFSDDNDEQNYSLSESLESLSKWI
jgi:hypothetical protein